MESCCHKDHTAPTPWVETVQLYHPLIVASAVALSVGILGQVGGRIPFMDGFMGTFLVIVGMLKLMNVQGFADAFARYDLLGMKSRLYATTYPTIETVLGVMFLVGLWPVLTHVFTFFVAAIGAVSAARVVQRGLIVNCACVGAGWSIPVGAVTVFEYAAMAGMALAGLIGRVG